MIRRTLLGLVGLLAVSTGCTPAGLWGNEARYAPDTRGYVISRSPEAKARLILRSPVTGAKIRCREDLDRYLVPITRETATRMHDENMAVSATLPATLALFPLAGTGMLLVVDGEAALGPPEGLRLLLSSPSAGTLYSRGRRAFDEGRFDEAERLFTRALAKRDTDPDLQRSTYFLGLLYERRGLRPDAARAFHTFVERAIVRDQAWYDVAEEHLAALDPGALTPCRSQAPVTFAWPAPR